MSISPINFNGMIQNTNEVSHTQAQEEQKSTFQQELLTHEVDRQKEQEAKQVNDLNKAEQGENRYDREGSGKGYEGNKGQAKKNTKPEKKAEKSEVDGKISQKPATSFDMRV
ncbi:MAG: hypothetical protein K6D38_11325 [Pseudobutyrivibrio sp.]|nr:hypothetical protein [Pseudobutyrivibrio sp.]